jgi:hypothetical protein
MMRVVLYAPDFEPITVIELPDFAVEYLERYGRVSIPVPPSVITLIGDDAMTSRAMPRVDIWAEKLRSSKGEHLMLFTQDDELALRLKAAFLPGQRSALQEAGRRAFAQGFLDALQRLGQ